MSREEMIELANPERFRSFTIVTVAGQRSNIPHHDYIDIPPLPEEAGWVSYVTVYNRGSVPRFIVLTNIDGIEFKPIRD
jgi:hypothetical protein